MIRLSIAMALLGWLAACGADGEPVQPTANLGIGISSSGVSAGGTVGVRQGPVAINVNVF